MTPVEQRLATDLTAAQRAGVGDEVTTLRLLKAAIHNEAIAKRQAGELDEAAVLGVLRRELKKRQEAAKLYEQGGRAELAAKEAAEAEMIKRYLPAAPAADDIRATVARLKQEQSLSGAQAVGPLTKAVMAHYQGAADGQTVASLVREALQNAD